MVGDEGDAVVAVQDFIALSRNAAVEDVVDDVGAERGIPARSAIGVNVLPGNLPVEIEAIFEIE